MNESNKVTLQEVLESKESRAMHQRMLLDCYKLPLISFMVNMPGSIKLCPMTREIHAEGMTEISQRLYMAEKKIVHKEVIEKKTGIEGYVVVNCTALELKAITCSIENMHPLGRLFDIDVIGLEGIPIKREELLLEPRKCLICNEVSSVCGRLRRHSTSELVAKIKSILDDYKGGENNRNSITD